MHTETWIQIDRRECARGYSIQLLRGMHITNDKPYVITLLLDDKPFWIYRNLSRGDAQPAMDDLQDFPGPRGDSTWKAVLERCTNPDKALESFSAPRIFLADEDTLVGSWEWLQALKHPTKTKSESNYENK